jgi:hypothetical protein
MSGYTKNNVPRFYVRGDGVHQAGASSLQFGPRYWDRIGPMDDTTVLAYYPMHSSSSDSILLDRDVFERLASWLSRPNGVWRLEQVQNSFSAEAGEHGGVHFKFWWNSTPGSLSGSFRADVRQVASLRNWMDDKITNGWVGWRSDFRRLLPAHLEEEAQR